MRVRKCSKTACRETAAATLTFDYSESLAVLGPLSLRAEPGSYDLCLGHAERFSVPKGWELLRLPGELTPAVPSATDLAKLADEVRVAGGVAPLGPLSDSSKKPQLAPPGPPLARRKGHLAVVMDCS